MAKENKTTYAILGLLCHEDMTGYDIKKRIDQSLSFFWDAGFGQIYPTLRTLEEDGLVEKRTEVSENRPNRIIYSITQNGRNKLREWLSMPTEKEYVKYEILLKLFFGGLLAPEENIKVINDFKHRNSISLETLQQFKEGLKQVLGQDQDHLYYYLTVLFGEKVYKAYLEWADEATELLKKLDSN